MKTKQKGAMSLLTVAIIMMLLTVAGCIFCILQGMVIYLAGADG